MITAFLSNLESIFAWVLEASWQASVLVVLVLLLQITLRGRLNPRWYHALWLLVILRLVLPTLPESALSLFQFSPHAPPVITQSVTEPIFITTAPAQDAALPPEIPAPAYPFSVYTVLAIIWLSGASGLSVVTWMVNNRFARHVRNATGIDDPHLLEIASDAKTKLGVRRPLRLIESAQVKGPAIMGLFHPTLILPEGVRAKFTDEELRFIFLHEFAHIKRGDLVVQWLIALLQILHWFNPVLWHAFRCMRADREPATDALVLSCEGEDQKESYGQVLVKLLEHYHARHSLPTLIGILEDKDQFKRRFLLIGSFTRGAYGWSLLGVLVLVILSVACLTKSKAASDGAFSVKMSKAEAKQKDIAALVNQKAINWVTVHQQDAVREESLRQQFGGPDLNQKIADARASVIQALIDRELIIQSYKASGGVFPRSYIEARINDIIADTYGGDRKAFLQTLSDRKVTQKMYEDEIEDNAIVGYSRNLHVEDPVWKYYENNLQRFPQDEQINVSVIMLKSSQPVSLSGPVDNDPQYVLAHQIVDQIRTSEDASLFARKYNRKINILDDGSPFWVAKDHFPGWLPFTWEDVEKMPVGQTTDVVTNDADFTQGDGPSKKFHYYYILHVNDRHPATVAATAETKKEENDLLEVERQRVRKEWLDSLRAKAVIQVFDEPVKADTSTKSTDVSSPASNLRDTQPLVASAQSGSGVAVPSVQGNLSPAVSPGNKAKPAPPSLHPYGLFLTGHVQDDPNLMPYAGYKPSFEEAIGSDNYEAVKSLLEKDNRFSAQDMREALLGNHPRIIRLLWDQGPPYYCAELTYAISQDQPITQIEEVLDKGTSANSREDNSLPLSVAARRGNVACAQLLIQHGVKIGPTNADDYPLDQAVAGKYPEMVDFLLKSGAQITKHTLTMAIRVSLDAGRIPDEGSSQIMKQFIQAGALKGIPAGEAAELLIIACQKQNPIILHQLLDAGLSPLSRCDWPSPGKGPTALDVIREQSVKPAGDGLGPLLHIMEMATKSTGALGRVFKMT